MEIEDSNQPSGNRDSSENRQPSRPPRRPRPEGRSGDRPRSGSRDRAPFGGERPRSGGRERSGRGGPHQDDRRSGPRNDEKAAPAPVDKTAVAADTSSSDMDAELLASVSRSFSLTIRLLPDPLRVPITLGYLLARSLDTVADTPSVVSGTRLEHLRALLDMIKYGADPEILRPLQRDLVGKQTHPGEQKLLRGLDHNLNWLETQNTEDRWELRRTLARIGRGQELDLLRFAEGTAALPKPLATAEELDEYTYFVAGCVGELWTRLCQRHLPAGWSKRSESEMMALGKRFGQGLQMVNILRDLPEDLSNGRCYLPADLLAAHGLEVADLLKSPQKARLLVDALRRKALEHLDAAWEYVLALKPYKLRYACALPVLIGLETLGLLAQTSPLETAERQKISRASIKTLVASAAVGAALSPWLNRLHRRLRSRATK